MKNLIFLFSIFLCSIATASDGFQNESEAGVVITGGNTENENYTLSQRNLFGWSIKNLLTLKGHYLKGFVKGKETARYWSLGLRYDRYVNDRLSFFTAYLLEGDRFAGYDPRHSVDLGTRYIAVKKEKFTLGTELGYRFTREHQTEFMVTKDFHMTRIEGDAEYRISSTFTARILTEYFYNFTLTEDYSINGDASLSAMITSVLSMKTSYGFRYRNVPPASLVVRTDRIFTTALVAKF